MSKVDKSKKSLLAKLIENAAFMAVNLEDIRGIIQEEGAVGEKMNGNGFMVWSEHPAQKSYNTTVGAYSKIIKQLTDLLPENKDEATAKAGDALRKFIEESKK